MHRIFFIAALLAVLASGIAWANQPRALPSLAQPGRIAGVADNISAAGGAPAASVSSALPFGLAWGDSPEKAQKLLKKQTTNVHRATGGDQAAGREIVDAQKYYDGQPFLVRCVFEKGKLAVIGLTAILAAYKNNLRRARELAQKFFIKKLNKKYILMKIEHENGVEKRFYKSDFANVETHCGEYGDRGAAIASILYRSLSAGELLFPDAILATERQTANQPPQEALRPGHMRAAMQYAQEPTEYYRFMQRECASIPWRRFNKIRRQLMQG